ncbi:MAG: enoyl-CoA hydratase-related protein [Gammaproteobacteria bacterium]|nr:enoyl-CoA hydratase-related protein [Gammaproteobacteria bacterium]
MNDELRFEVTQGIALITLNRPDAYNSLSSAIIDGLGQAYRECDENDDIRVVVVTGAGKAFCAGADMSGGGATFDGSEQRGDIDSCPLAVQAWDVRKPVIAACNGHAVGAGLGLAVQCDMRILANEGKYGFLQSRRGVVTDFAMEYVLPRLVGFERAFELLVRAPRLSGEEAVAWGLASRSLPSAEVLDHAMELATEIARDCSPLAVGLHKRLLWRGLDMSLGELAAAESRALNHSMALPDAIEGGMAYLEKRRPRWTSSVTRDWPQWLQE